MIRVTLRQRFNQLRMDHQRITEVEAEIFDLQQLKMKLDQNFYLRKARYEADQRAWFEATHETIVTPKPKSSSKYEDILSSLLTEALEEKGWKASDS